MRHEGLRSLGIVIADGEGGTALRRWFDDGLEDDVDDIALSRAMRGPRWSRHRLRGQNLGAGRGLAAVAEAVHGVLPARNAGARKRSA